MTLHERAKLLKALGLLPVDADLKAIVAAAEEGDVDPEFAPATAIFEAAGVLLTICDFEVSEPSDIPGIIARMQEFSGNAFTVTDIKTTSAGVETVIGEGVDENDEPIEEELEEETILVEMTVDGQPIKAEVTRFAGMMDMGFINEIHDVLEARGEKRQFCPLLEIVDTDARFLFADPEAVDEAELREIITSPDFEEDI
jgi:hypothetical protein